MRFCRH